VGGSNSNDDTPPSEVGIIISNILTIGRVTTAPSPTTGGSLHPTHKEDTMNRKELRNLLVESQKAVEVAKIAAARREMALLAMTIRAAKSGALVV